MNAHTITFNRLDPESFDVIRDGIRLGIIDRDIIDGRILYTTLTLSPTAGPGRFAGRHESVLEAAEAIAATWPTEETPAPAADQDTKPARRGPRNGSRTVNSPRPRRFRKTATTLARILGYRTAANIMVRNGIPAEVADRYAAQITRTAAKNGVEPTATTYTKHRGQWLPTRAYNLAAHGLRLLLALATYRPAAPKRLRNGQPSKAKAELAKAAKLAAYLRAIGSLARVTA